MNGEPETIAGIPAAVVQEALEKREAAKHANAMPFPGPLKDAFAIAPNIKIDKYEVRPFYDGDFDVLVSLGNPLGEVLSSTLAGKEHADYFPRGQTAWEICYLFTNDIEKCFGEVKDGTFKEKARLAFCQFRLAGLVEIHNAVMKQMAIYWSTAIGYEASDDGEEGVIKKK